MSNELEQMREPLLAAIADAPALDALETIRVDALGKQGRITQLLKTLGKMSPEERQVEGPKIHGLREAVTEALGIRKAALEQAALDARLASERLDMTLPVDAGSFGTVHPVSQVMDELAEIFADLGFAVATGPEVETDWHNFTALNIPETHPARAMHDTFYLAGVEAGGCAPTPRRCRSAPCWTRSRRSASSRRAAPIAPTRMRRTRRCSIRSRGW